MKEGNEEDSSFISKSAVSGFSWRVPFSQVLKEGISFASQQKASCEQNVVSDLICWFCEKNTPEN